MRIRTFVLTQIAALAVLLIPGSPAIAAENPCSFARALPIDGTLHVDGLEAEDGLFSIEVPAPGFLALEISVPATGDAIPWIAFLSQDCSSGETASRGAHVVERSPSRRILAIFRKGTYYVRTGSIHAGPLGSYSLSSRFVDPVAAKDGDDEVPEEGESEIVPGKDEGNDPDEVPEEGESEIVPGKDGEGDPGDVPEEGESEIVPILTGGYGEDGPSPIFDLEQLVKAVYGRCSGLGEPANDLTFCARRLQFGKSLEGSIDRGDGDDHDYFTFALRRSRVIRITASGRTDTLGSLYDERGHRLMVADDGDEGEGFVLEASLNPGRYYVRVEGAWHAEGDYSIRLTGSR